MLNEYIENEVVNLSSNRQFTLKKHKAAQIAPKVSVIVPIYNADYTLRQALESLAAQTLFDIEIICVDDASPDSSRDIIEEFFVNDNRFIIITHKENAGYGASMNDGIQCASGEWIAILEPDDYVSTNMYQSMLKFCGKDKHAIDVIKTPYLREIRAEGVKRGDDPLEILNCSYRHRIHPRTQPFKINDRNANHLLRHHPSIWSALYRRTFLIENNIRFVEYHGSGWADNEFFYETLLSANAIVYFDEPFYVYREETDEEYNAFARANKHLPFDRWHSMFDIIEKRGYGQDEGIERSHVSKGFTYLSGELKANTNEQGFVDSEVVDEMNKMFDRMDATIVASEPKINPGLKKRFFDRCQYLNETENQVANPSSMRYYFGLIGELLYAIRNNGVGYAVKQVKKVISG